MLVVNVNYLELLGIANIAFSVLIHEGSTLVVILMACVYS